MKQWFVDDTARRDDPRVPIGYPLPGNRLALVDGDDAAALDGEVGELLVHSAYVSLGRWVDGHLARERVATGERRGCGEFRTGDLVRRRPDGLLERLGRKDRQVKIRGSRVDLDGVDAMLRGHARVRDVAAVARPTDTDGTITLVAYVSVDDEAHAEVVDELKALMRSAPAPMRPAHYYLVPSIPRLPNSKLDVRALGAMDGVQVQAERTESIGAAASAAIAGDRVSQTVARVWYDVLHVPVRAADDDFFDSGGDSLKAVSFVIELERALGFELPLTSINEAPRFDQLCETLRERRPIGSTPLVTLKAGDGQPPLFFVHGLGGHVASLLPAARRVTYPGAVIGIRARGLVPGETPHASIDAMAEDYLSAIKERQPSGPYYLCGYSFGGLVAFEMARRLSESDDEVGFVGLFDTTMRPGRWPLTAWFSIIARRLALFAGVARGRPIRTWPTTIRVGVRALIASATYRPGFYRGRLTLFSPEGREALLPSLESVWCKHAEAVVVVKTAGTHATMLSALHAETTALCLTRCLTATS